MLSSESISDCVRLACLAEVHSTKAGNVSPSSPFADLAISDFCRSAEVICGPLAQSRSLPLGTTILQAAQATRAVVNSNTNLGIILLLAPLCAARLPLTTESVNEVLVRTTTDDAIATYAAIEVMQPSGLGKVEDQDLSAPPSQTLLQCMALAKERDQIAAEYANGFSLVLGAGQDFLQQAILEHPSDPLSLVAVLLIAQYGDSLIKRKCGEDMDREARQRAQEVLDSNWPRANEGRSTWDRFDQWLRADGNQRNPGTTADLIAAIVFAALRNQKIRIADHFLPVGRD